MSNNEKFYINGEWVEPQGAETIEVINPATEEGVGTVRLGNHGDVAAAVAAAAAVTTAAAPVAASRFQGAVIQLNEEVQSGRRGAGEAAILAERVSLWTGLKAVEDVKALHVHQTLLDLVGADLIETGVMIHGVYLL